jgi:uncharacterized phage-associated protein
VLDLQHQQKLIEAISYFAANTKHCGFTKLFKLLYWLDYHHFRETGETVTGLSYQAFPYGPVPDSLYKELKDGRGDVADHFEIERHKRIEFPRGEGRYLLRTLDDDDEKFARAMKDQERSRNALLPGCLKPRRPYVHRYLTRREQRIAAHMAEIFRDATAEQISDVSHAKGGPWQQALKDRGERGEIDFLGKLFPVGKGNYLDEAELRRRVAEHKEDVADFA